MCAAVAFALGLDSTLSSLPAHVLHSLCCSRGTDRQRFAMAVERSSQEVHPSSLVPEYRPFQRSDVCLLHARQLCSNDFTLHNVTICGLAESQLPLRYENELSAERAVLLVDEKTSGSGLYVLHMAREGTPCKVATTDALGSSSAPIHVFSRPEFTEPLMQMGK